MNGYAHRLPSRPTLARSMEHIARKHGFSVVDSVPGLKRNSVPRLDCVHIPHRLGRRYGLLTLAPAMIAELLIMYCIKDINSRLLCIVFVQTYRRT